MNGQEIYLSDFYKIPIGTIVEILEIDINSIHFGKDYYCVGNKLKFNEIEYEDNVFEFIFENKKISLSSNGLFTQNTKFKIL